MTCYDTTLGSIRANVENKKNWGSIDKTTDVKDH